jgi:hypothetical protein
VETTEEAPTDGELFVPDSFPELGEWEPKRLDLAGTVRFGRWAARLSKTGYNVIERYGAGADTGTIINDFLDMLADPDSATEIEQAIAEFFSIILSRGKDQRSRQWVNDNWNMDTALECVAAWLILENLGKVSNSGSKLIGLLLPKRGLTLLPKTENANASEPSDA